MQVKVHVEVSAVESGSSGDAGEDTFMWNVAGGTLNHGSPHAEWPPEKVVKSLRDKSPLEIYVEHHAALQKNGEWHESTVTVDGQQVAMLVCVVKGMFKVASVCCSPLGYPAVNLYLGTADQLGTDIWDVEDMGCNSAKMILTDVPWGKRSLAGYTTVVPWQKVMSSFSMVAQKSMENNIGEQGANGNNRQQSGVTHKEQWESEKNEKPG
jgi:hypothetical protein